MDYRWSILVSASYKHIQFRRATQNSLDKANPILKEGESAFATDTSVLKIGDGKTSWRNLPEFISTRTLTTKAITTTIPAITNGNTGFLFLTFEGVKSENDYFVITNPDTELPANLRIDYSYIFNDNMVKVQLSAVGGDVTLTNSVKLYVTAYTVNEVIATTTAAPDPIPEIDEAYSFGGNQFGQLSQGNTNDLNTPKLIDNSENWSDLSAGHYHSAGVSDSNKLYTCGYNYYGQLGQGDSGPDKSKKTFTEVATAYEEDSSKTKFAFSSLAYSGVSAGSNNTATITDNDGRLLTVGSNAYGCLGLGDTVQRDSLTLVAKENGKRNLKFDYVAGIPVTINNNKYVFSVFNSSYAGTNHFFMNRLGEHKILNVPNSGHAMAIVGASHEDNKTINSQISYSGQYFVNSQTVDGVNYPFYSGDITIDVSGDYQQVKLRSLDYADAGGTVFNYEDPDGGWSDVSAGHQHMIGIKTGKLYAWGNNTFGQLGDGGHTTYSKPKLVNNNDNWVKVSAGDYHSLALDKDGRAWSAGQNDFGQLGQKDTVDRLRFTKIVGTQESLADFNVITLDADSFTRMDNNNLVINMPTRTSVDTYDSTNRYVVSEGTYILYNIATGDAITLLNNNIDGISISGTILQETTTITGTDNDGTYNFYAGDITIDVTKDFGSMSLYSRKLTHAGGKDLLHFDAFSKNVTDMSAGNGYSLFLNEAKEVFVCGSNEHGKLGLGDKRNRNYPIRLEGAVWSEISAGSNHSLFVDQYRNLWSAGANERGALGLGDNMDRTNVTKINNDINWARPSAGGTHSLVGVFSYYPNAPTSITAKNATTSDRAGHYEIDVEWVNDSSLIDGVNYYVLEEAPNGTTSFTPLSYKSSLDPPKSRIISYASGTGAKIYRVKAVNSFGESAYSPISDPVTPAALIDSEYCNVEFLAHFNGDVEEPSEQAAFFKDYSKNNMTYQTDSAVRPVRTDGGKFGSALNPFATDNVRYDVPNTLACTGDFTIEFWYKPVDRTTVQTIFELTNLEPVSDPYKMKIYYDGSDNIVAQGFSSTFNIGTVVLPEDDLWHHFAWVRNNGVNYLWLDETRSVTTLTEAAPVTYEATADSRIILQHGLIDEVRFTNNVARYNDSYGPEVIRSPQRPFGENDGTPCP